MAGFWETAKSTAEPALVVSGSFIDQLRAAVTLRIIRVNQVDASELDTRLTAMLKASLKQILYLIRANWYDELEPEITALLQLFMFALSLWRSDATYGLQLRSLKYRDERHSSHTFDAPLRTSQKLLWAALQILVPWFVVRLNRWSIDTSDSLSDSEHLWRSRLWKIFQRLETVYGVASLLNFLIFLYDGRYRSIIDRLLEMRSIYSRKQLNQQVSFEFQNRQMLWHAFTECLLFVMPVINLQQLQSSIMRRLALPSPTITSDDNETSATTCPMCKADPIGVPYEAQCEHVFCYTCIKTALMTNNNQCPCPVCGEKIVNISRITSSREAYFVE